MEVSQNRLLFAKFAKFNRYLSTPPPLIAKFLKVGPKPFANACYIFYKIVYLENSLVHRTQIH